MGKAMLGNPHTPEEARGCESCHGPGRAHVEAGGGKDTISIRFGKDSPSTVAEQNAVCIDCHNRGTHMFWKGSPHESRGIACVDCHQVKQGVFTRAPCHLFLGVDQPSYHAHIVMATIEYRF